MIENSSSERFFSGQNYWTFPKILSNSQKNSAEKILVSHFEGGIKAAVCIYFPNPTINTVISIS